MIKYNPKRWATLIFHSYSRDIFQRAVPNLVYIAIYCVIFTALYELYLREYYYFSSVVHSLLGIVLGLFLVFRTNSAYDKWWEGRKIWGSTVNDSRNLALKLSAFIPENRKAEREVLTRYIQSYVVAMKDHLRDDVQLENTSLTAEEKNSAAEWDHKPNYIASKMYQLVNSLYKEGVLTGDQLFIIDKEIKGLTDHIGACERIKNTPIPFSYSMYIKKSIFWYSITLPMGFVTQFHWYTPFIVSFIFYFLITIELIAEEIEDPFGMDDNDLPTDELSEKIGENVQEILVKTS